MLEEAGAAKQSHPLDQEPEAEDPQEELTMWDFAQYCRLKGITTIANSPPRHDTSSSCYRNQNSGARSTMLFSIGGRNKRSNRRSRSGFGQIGRSVRK